MGAGLESARDLSNNHHSSFMQRHRSVCQQPAGTVPRLSSVTLTLARHTRQAPVLFCITKLSASNPKQETVNALFDANVHSEEEMEAWLAARRVVNDNPKNGEEAALSKAGAEA